MCVNPPYMPAKYIYLNDSPVEITVSFCVSCAIWGRGAQGQEKLTDKRHTHTAFRPPFLKMPVDNGINFNHCTQGY